MFRRRTREDRKAAQVAEELEPQRVEERAEHRAELVAAAAAVERARVARVQTASLRDRMEAACLPPADQLVLHPWARTG